MHLTPDGSHLGGDGCPGDNVRVRPDADIRGTLALPPVAVRTLRMPSPQYLIAHACFACRKSFKVAPRPAFTSTCPNCSALLHEMGRSFKAPPTKDTEQWAKVQALFDAGFRFSSYRSADGPPLPDHLSEVDGFIRDNPEHPLRVAPPQSRSGRGIS